MARKSSNEKRRRSKDSRGIRRPPASPKTTRPEAEQRRDRELGGPAPGREQGGVGSAPAKTPSGTIPRTFDALPDRIDQRDWVYRPTLHPLPNELVNIDHVPPDGVLDQGTEGACTGFALAAVINFLLHRRNVRNRVSPRMLYEIARRYDEWPGESYEGSSARGAMKGWVMHGVCSRDSWPDHSHGLQHFESSVAREATEVPGGAYYRVLHREIRDMHAALHEAGILYMTLIVHDGWFDPGPSTLTVTYADRYTVTRNIQTRTLPVIERRGRASGGHAVAIVGYVREGFIIQNSWGPSWGADGFALLPYEDYMLHSTDVWVAQLGVPVATETWTERDLETSGIARAKPAVSLAEIRPHVINIGNNGYLSESGKYWTTERDIERLFSEHIPAHINNGGKPRVLLYCHGGLNDESADAKRIIAFKDVFLDNGIYPVHIMWETGFGGSLLNMIQDVFTDEDERAAGFKDWMEKFRDHLVEAKDRSIELTTAGPIGAVWREMTENAGLACAKGRAMETVVRHAHKALKPLSEKDRSQWELHVIAHSAGSIFIAHAAPLLAKLGLAFKSMHLLAPAMTLDLFKQTLMKAVTAQECPYPTLFNLSEDGELDDVVGPYGKSLLYLVSNAFEKRRGTPLLGITRYVNEDAEAIEFFSKKVDGKWPSLVIAGETQQPGNDCRSDTHGGFDNDEWTMNSILRRILGGTPKRAFTKRDLQY